MKNCLIYIKNLCKSIQKKQEDIKQHKRNAAKKFVYTIYGRTF